MTVLTILTTHGKVRPAAFDTLDAEVRWAEADTLASALPGSDALLMWDFFSDSLKNALPAADQLAWVHVPSAGVDSLRIPGLMASDITVTNAHGVFDQAIAEYVLGVILMFAKKSVASLDLQRDHVWRRRETETLAGTRALIVGTGGIGRRTARLLRACDIDVVGAATQARKGDANFTRIIDSADLVSHVGDVDWVINAAPLTDLTRGMFDAKLFAAMKGSVRYVSIGRGATTVTDDLLTALTDGTIAGAGLDVVDPEPLPAGHPLWDAPNTLITAHLSGDTQGWTDRLTQQFLEHWDLWVAGKPFPQTVNLAAGYVPS